MLILFCFGKCLIAQNIFNVPVFIVALKVLPFLKQKTFEPLFTTWSCKGEKRANTILPCKWPLFPDTYAAVHLQASRWQQSSLCSLENEEEEPVIEGL